MMSASCHSSATGPCLTLGTAADFTEELRRSKRSRTRSPILDDILEEEMIEVPSRRGGSPPLEDEQDPMLHAECSQSGTPTTGRTADGLRAWAEHERSTGCMVHGSSHPA